MRFFAKRFGQSATLRRCEIGDGQLRRMLYRMAGFAALVSLLIGYSAGVMIHLSPYPVQRLLSQSPLGTVVVVVLALVSLAALGVWGNQPGHADRIAFVAGIISVGTLAFIVNVLAPSVGWWGGRIFEAPLFPLAALTALRAIVLAALLLALYRWLAHRRRWLALLAYSLISLALIPATIYGDAIFLRTGALTFSGGYTISLDAAVGEVLLVFPPVIYEFLLAAPFKAG